MDLSVITSLSGLSGTSGLNYLTGASSLTGTLAEKTDLAEGGMFGTILNSAIDNIKTTNSYLSDAENEEIKFALGETDNSHDLGIALQKASAALQYTVAIRDRLLDAYKELIQMQV